MGFMNFRVFDDGVLRIVFRCIDGNGRFFNTRACLRMASFLEGWAGGIREHVFFAVVREFLRWGGACFNMDLRNIDLSKNAMRNFVVVIYDNAYFADAILW
ncbi:hypothetical protein ACS0Y3_36415 [Burkholderia gladioli]|uniref:hypothetical protein n=1 Tax=Burkholderia gladioli TaxID=28095 RepID=UPI003F79A530